MAIGDSAGAERVDECDFMRDSLQADAWLAASPPLARRLGGWLIKKRGSADDQSAPHQT
jgi:hypothetical protein